MAKEGGAAVHITPIVRKHRQVDAGMQLALLNSDRWLLGCSLLSLLTSVPDSRPWHGVLHQHRGLSH